MTRVAVFVDRDGVLNELVPDPLTGNPESPLRQADVALIGGAPAALGRIQAAGFLVVGVSNQPAAAKGLISVADLHGVHTRVLELLAADGVVLDRFSVCLHHPNGQVPELTRTCPCRKPAPGMLADAARDLGIDLSRSWMVGDADSDVAAGAAAGARTILIENPASAHRRTKGSSTQVKARDLTAAAEIILGWHGR